MMGGAGNLNIHSDLLMKKDERDSFAAKGVAALAWRDRLRNSVSLGIECGGAVGNKANENGENASKSHNGNCRRFYQLFNGLKGFCRVLERIFRLVRQKNHLPSVFMEQAWFAKNKSWRELPIEMDPIWIIMWRIGVAGSFLPRVYVGKPTVPQRDFQARENCKNMPVREMCFKSCSLFLKLPLSQ